MAKSLEELQLAFKAQYPKNEDNKQEEPKAPVKEEPKELVKEEPREPVKEEPKEPIKVLTKAPIVEAVKEPTRPIEEPVKPIEKPTKIIDAKTEAEIEAKKDAVRKKKETGLNEKKLERRLQSQLKNIQQKDIQPKEIKQEDKKKQEEAQSRQEKIDSLTEEAKTFEKTSKEKRAKASVISDILFYGTLILMVVFAVLFSRGAFGNQTFGGYSFYEVLTTSMESVYPRGSLIVIKETDPSELIVGDDIAFTVASNDLVTHRIIEIKEDYEGMGQRAFTTKGVDNALADSEDVLAKNVVGKVIRGFSGVGTIFSWLGENLWLVVTFFLSLIALSFFLKKFWNGNKKRQLKEKQAENEQVKDKNIKAKEVRNN